MAKPTKLPEFNSGLANQTEPSGGKKILGWTLNEIPPSGYFNWLFYYIYLWLKWIDDGVWTAISLTLSGALTVDSLAVANNITQSAGTASLNNVTCGTITPGTLTLGVASQATVAGQFNVNTGAQYQVNNDLAASVGGVTNQVSARTVHKAHASIVLNNTATPTIDANDSFNAPSVAVSSSILTLGFGTNFFAAGCLPNVVVTLGDEKGTTLYHAYISSRTRSDVNIKIRDGSGTLIDPAGAALNTLRVYVHVEGKQ